MQDLASIVICISTSNCMATGVCLSTYIYRMLLDDSCTYNRVIVGPETPETPATNKKQSLGSVVSAGS